MKDAKMLVLIKNVDVRLLQKLQEVINEHNAESEKQCHKAKEVKS